MKILYIDVQNLHKRTSEMGWIIDWHKLYVYLRTRYEIDVLYYAVGYLPQNQHRYDLLEKIGYTMLFKDALILPNGEVKGNVDIDIAIQSILDLTNNTITQAYLMTNDGDYNTLVKTFQAYNVWGTLFAPDARSVSRLLTRLSNDIVDIQRRKNIVQKSPSELGLF